MFSCTLLLGCRMLDDTAANELMSPESVCVLLLCRVAAVIVFSCTLLLGCCTFAARHAVVRIFTEDASIRAATVAVVPAVATSIIGEQPCWCSNPCPSIVQPPEPCMHDFKSLNQQKRLL
jgi:hypothetical protein